MIEVVEANLALPAHGEALIRLLDEYARDPMGGGSGLPEQAKAGLALALHGREGAHVVLAFADGLPAGLIVCFEGFSTFACKPLLNIHDVMVMPAYRGKGIFSRMLEQVEAIAVRLDCCKLTLEVLEGNHAAQAAYRTAGFAGYELDPAMGKAMFWQKKLRSL